MHHLLHENYFKFTAACTSGTGLARLLLSHKFSLRKENPFMVYNWCRRHPLLMDFLNYLLVDLLVLLMQNDHFGFTQHYLSYRAWYPRSMRDRFEQRFSMRGIGAIFFPSSWVCSLKSCSVKVILQQLDNAALLTSHAACSLHGSKRTGLVKFEPKCTAKKIINKGGGI